MTKTAITSLLVMTEENNQGWLLELGQILRDLGDTDSALAASLAYDLSHLLPKAQRTHPWLSNHQRGDEKRQADNYSGPDCKKCYKEYQH